MNEARGQFADFFGRLWRQKPLGIAGGVVIVLLILVAIFADALAPYPFDQLSLAERCRAHRLAICWGPTSWAATC